MSWLKKVSAVLVSLCGACATAQRPQPAPKPALVWTDDAVRVERVTYAPLSGSQQGAPPAPQEPYVPRLLCNDATPSVNCTRDNPAPDCCAIQGGLQHDAWGNTIAQ